MNEFFKAELIVLRDTADNEDFNDLKWESCKRSNESFISLKGHVSDGWVCKDRSIAKERKKCSYAISQYNIVLK